MDISGILQNYGVKQRNVFAGFCIQLPLDFTVLYLYIPNFKYLDIYVQSIFSATASILSIYYCFAIMIICAAIAKHKFLIEIPILILPTLGASYLLITRPENYSLGYEYILQTFLQSSLITYMPISLFQFIYRKCIEYDIRHKREKE